MSFLLAARQASTPNPPATTKVKGYWTNDTPPQWRWIDESSNVVRALDSFMYNAKGDLLGASADNTPLILAVGAQAQVLTVDSAAASGLKYDDPPQRNTHTAGQTGFAADAYLSGSTITLPAGAWLAGTIYKCTFDMVKTNAGTQTPIITVRMGTLGTTGDASIMTFTFAAGTAAVDTGVFEVVLGFRSVGGGTSAVIGGYAKLDHALVATGLSSTGAAGTGVITGASAGFNSTTQTKIGLSFNGGTSFAGTNVVVQTMLIK